MNTVRLLVGVKLCVRLCHSVTNPLLEFGLDFLDAHLSVVFGL